MAGFFKKISIILLAATVMISLNNDCCGNFEVSGKVKTTAKTRKKTSAKRTRNNKAKKRKSTFQVIYKNADTGEWIHKGKKGIITHRDSLGNLRSMAPFSANPHLSQAYSAAINDYAHILKEDSIRVYSLIAPSQGEFYMPPQVPNPVSEQYAIETAVSYLDSIVIPVLVCENLRNHIEEDIYNRTDHHWSPLGAFYAAEVFSREAGVSFSPLENYEVCKVKDYVGTMYKFSGDPEIKKYPEEFVYFKPKVDYEAEFITYRLNNKKTVGESLPSKEPFFKYFPDGSGAAYSTFMGGDPKTVKVKSSGMDTGRKLAIVKDSFGNALAPCLFTSFDEVHVIDFRYFPHDLVDYVRENGITDLLFINCVSIAFDPDTAKKIRSLHFK